MRRSERRARVLCLIQSHFERVKDERLGDVKGQLSEFLVDT